jgi:hypothetical protein
MDLRNEHSVVTKSFLNKLRKQAGNYDNFAKINQEEIKKYSGKSIHAFRCIKYGVLAKRRLPKMKF